jgi:hypothetical protein
MTKIGSIGVGSLGGVSSTQLDIQTADIELLLASVQQNRAVLIEDQLRQMIQTVQDRNATLSDMNTLKADLGSQKAYFSGNTAGGSLIDQPHYDPSTYDKKTLQDAYKNAKTPAEVDAVLARARNGEFGKAGIELATVAQSMRAAGFDDATVVKVGSGSITSAELDAAIGTATSKADSLSSSQQIDMVRMQSLQQRRGEAFDIITNTYKKMGDNRSSIVSNMR